MTGKLELKNVTKRYGGVVSIDDVTLSLGGGGVCSVIGANGAGKTTLFNVISGVVTATSGTVTFDGTDTTNLTPDKINQLGLSRTFQNLALFGSMTVRDTVQVGYHRHIRANIVDAAFRTPRHRKGEREAGDATDKVLERLGLEEHANNSAADLPYGLQRRVELARALVGGPKLVLLDEPMAGLSDSESEAIAAVIQEEAKEGASMLLVEHHLRTVMAISDRIVVLEWGTVIGDGTPKEIRENEAVISSYLGSGRA